MESVVEIAVLAIFGTAFVVAAIYSWGKRMGSASGGTWYTLSNVPYSYGNLSPQCVDAYVDFEGCCFLSRTFMSLLARPIFPC